MSAFRKALQGNKVLIFDGAMGTLLQSRGLVPGQSPEQFGRSNPEAVAAAHRDYLEAGADVITTNTFGGTAYKLGTDIDVRAFNAQMAAVARKEAGDKHFVAGSVGPTGHMVRPLGNVGFTDLVQAFRTQIRGLVEGGVDCILAETHFDLAEAKAVVVAARQECDLPVGVSMTFEGGCSLTGTPPHCFVDTMQNLDVDLLATNCSAGPEQLVEVVRDMLPRLQTPLLVEPNAGLPELIDGETVFNLGPEAFAQQMRQFVELGVGCVGGCCGTSPDHIRALGRECPEKSAAANSVFSPCPPVVVTSRFGSVTLGPKSPLALIGERINPTGKKDLTAELQAGELQRACALAAEQVQAGATVLDINVGAPLVEESQLIPELVLELSRRQQVPLCLDSADPDAIELGLQAAPGSPLVNSISGEEGKMERLAPLCVRYGAPFILLPLEGGALPVSAESRLSIIQRLIDKALALGVPKRLIVVDALALTVSSKPEAARACLETIRACQERWAVPSVLGLSNISFGLPARELLNSTFLTMATGAGLSGCIANPGSVRLQEALAASEVLLGRDPQAQHFIQGYAEWTPGTGAVPARATASGGGEEERTVLQRAVIKGETEVVTREVQEALRQGSQPFELVNNELIPGIMAVGEKYEKKEYFLPQLLLSAEAMQAGFELLRPLLEAAKDQEKPKKIILATVEGDIHDIGKNIVALLLRNHGFEVVDLGKDVPAETIVQAAEEHEAELIGLSALMTTTMVKMEQTLELVRKRGLSTQVLVGGAVVTPEYARVIGAHGYAADAVGAVKKAKELVAE
ncbi:homocysteine S-methyltransferase family protein [Desulfohalobium retbaense]|uniref:Methionine synthase n=1 Tax=Desulfohalobium retbaense (strain ATCC 49708 / DSM 5692 / JCM 16813 / HR100) TaxID=485915 RepID=C8X153_DESRD|nr:homocysteine S-methyltransferase family protein [Desulfohalobium retbaense]ACV68150.1 homocysteine S-methyltransferase [Desulfohalobium retbaense DSM 5692]